MKIVFNILVIVAAAVALFFSVSLKGKFEEQQTKRLDTIDRERTVTASADATDAEIAKQQSVLDKSLEERDLASARVETATATGRTLQSEVDDLIARETAQKEEFAELEKTLDEVAQIAADLGAEMGTEVTLDNLGDKIKELEDRRLAQQTKLEEMETLVSGAQTNLAGKREEAQRLAERAAARNRRIALNATESVITAVNQDWGFVVIGAGSNAGFTPQTDLLVKRDGRVIGTVTPSAIEPSQTIAEIDAESLAPGVRLQVGDRVIIAKPAAN